jgi:hypothetical protein
LDRKAQNPSDLVALSEEKSERTWGMLQNPKRRQNMEKIEKEKQEQEFQMAELLWTIKDLEETVMLEGPKNPISGNKRKEGKRQGHH